MSKIVVFTHLTLDGVMQAPGRADEDPRGGFKHGGWALPRKDNPFTEVLDNAQKYVASTTLTEPLAWKNSALLKGDAADLVDEYFLMIHPLVLGSGRRLFPDNGTSARLRLVDAKTTTTGVVIATYRPAERTGAKIQEDAR